MISQRHDHTDEIQTTYVDLQELVFRLLELVFQKLNDEPSISNKFLIEMDVSVIFVPKLSETKNSDIFSQELEFFFVREKVLDY